MARRRPGRGRARGRRISTRQLSTNSPQGFIQSLGEDEGVLYADVDVAAVRRFPGYFYRSTSA